MNECPEPPSQVLTTRERQCLDGVAALKDSKTIANELGISPKTVDGHIERAVRKLGARDRRDAARRLCPPAFKEERVAWEPFPREPIPVLEAVSDPQVVVVTQPAPERPAKATSSLMVVLMVAAIAAAIAIVLLAVPSLVFGAQELANRIDPPTHAALQAGQGDRKQ